MSDLQFGLIAIGALVVVGVYLFNVWQERRFRNRLENAFKDRPADTLLETQTEPPPEQARVEPHLEGEPRLPDASPGEPVAGIPEAAAPVSEPVAPAVTPAPEETEAEPQGEGIDYRCVLRARTPIPAAAVAQLMKDLTSVGKPVTCTSGQPGESSWTALLGAGAAPVTRAGIALQLVDRSGPVNRVQLATFRDLVSRFATQAEASCDCPDIDGAAQAAAELDRFCAAVDISVGFNVVTRASEGVAGTKVRGLLEAAGFRLDSDGRFTLRSDRDQVLVSVENLGGPAFSAPLLRDVPVRGLSLSIDVPRVPDDARAFDRMVEVGRQLAQGLDAVLIDDNKAPLSEAGLEKIRQQLRTVYAAMHARGIAAGSRAALRLFA